MIRAHCHARERKFGRIGATNSELEYCRSFTKNPFKLTELSKQDFLSRGSYWVDQILVNLNGILVISIEIPLGWSNQIFLSSLRKRRTSTKHIHLKFNENTSLYHTSLYHNKRCEITMQNNADQRTESLSEPNTPCLKY